MERPPGRAAIQCLGFLESPTFAADDPDRGREAQQASSRCGQCDRRALSARDLPGVVMAQMIASLGRHALSGAIEITQNCAGARHPLCHCSGLPPVAFEAGDLA